MTTTLKQKHDEFIAKAKESGAKTLTYRTPCCNKEVEDRVPPKGDVWDTMTVCPHCEKHFFKTATASKIVGELIPESV